MNKYNLILHCAFLILFGYFLWLDINNKCDMSKNLMDLLGIVSEVLEKHNIKFWLSWGSLLGYIRDNALPPQDYDIDIVINPNDYDRVLALKSEFKKRGYTLYGKDAYLPYYIIRKKMSIITFRLYNDKTHYFLEFFDGYLVPPNERKYPQVLLPENYKINSSYICTGRQDHPAATEFCYNYNDVYPLKKVKAFKEEYSLYIPNHPHKLLKQLYGSSYMIPQAKGYKAIFCYTKPKYTLLSITTIYLFIIIIFKLFI